MLRREQQRQRDAEDAAHRHRQALAGDLPARIEAAPARRRSLDQKRRGRTDLATEGEPLQQAAEDDDDRRRDADARVARRGGQPQRSDGDERDGQDHRWLAARPVGKGTDQDAAERAGEEAHAEGRHRGQQAAELASHRKEGLADVDREVGVDDEVVELERVAGHRCRHRLAADGALAWRTVGRRSDHRRDGRRAASVVVFMGLGA